VRAVPCRGRDFNLSGPADLLAANLHALALSGKENWIDERASVDSGASLARSVVMEGAHVERGAHLERVLVLPGERVPPGEHRDVVFAVGEAVVARE